MKLSWYIAVNTYLHINEDVTNNTYGKQNKTSLTSRKLRKLTGNVTQYISSFVPTQNVYREYIANNEGPS